MIELIIPKWEDIFNDQAYQNLFNYQDRIEIYYGGASSGKSHGVYQKTVIKTFQDWVEPRRILYLRKVGNTIRDSSWQHVKDILSDFKILPKCKINKSDFNITLPNKAELLFRGLDDPEKIKSIKGISDVVMEELTEFTEEDFIQMNLRVRDKSHKNKQLFGMFNPVHPKNWTKKYFFESADNGKAKIYHSTYKDNRFLDEQTKEEIEDLKNRNLAFYKIYALGEYATLDKLIFENYETRIISKEEVAILPLFIGLDFGYVNDPSALIVVRYDEVNKIIYITQEYVRDHLLNDKIANAIINLGFAKEIIHADSQEMKSIDEIKLKGVSRIKPVEKGPNSVIHGIQWLLQHKIVVDERCFKTIEEFENYSWKKDKKSGEYLNEATDTYNHTIDALRYALEDKIKSVMKPRILKRAMYGI